MRFKKSVPQTSSDKISETNSNFHVKEHTARKVSSQYFGTLLLVLPNFLFSHWDCGPGTHSVKFRHFPNIS